MSAYLDVRDLSHCFTDGSEKTETFRGVSFTLNKGEFLCIIGPSGCGKTTLLRSLAGFVKPDSGDILLDGTQITGPGIHCAMVFQTFDQLLPWKTVLDNVAYPLLVSKNVRQNKNKAREMAREYLDMVGLAKNLDFYPHQLSGGMKQRAAIARSLVTKPQLILMDEPFASVDASTRESLQMELLRIWETTGATVIFVTHSIIEAIILSTKIMAMGHIGKSLELYIENPVKREEGIVLRTPQSSGYAECWTLLRNTIREKLNEEA